MRAALRMCRGMATGEGHPAMYCPEVLFQPFPGVSACILNGVFGTVWHPWDTCHQLLASFSVEKLGYTDTLKLSHGDIGLHRHTEKKAEGRGSTCGRWVGGKRLAGGSARPGVLRGPLPHQVHALRLPPHPAASRTAYAITDSHHRHV